MSDNEENEELEVFPLVHWVYGFVPAQDPSCADLCNLLNEIDDEGFEVVHISTVMVKVSNLSINGSNPIPGFSVLVSGTREDFKEKYGFDYSIKDLPKAIKK